MRKLVKTIDINEAIKIADKEIYMAKLLDLFPNYFGINLCSVNDITIKCTDDEYGQLTDLNITFKPGTDYEAIKANGGPWPWLKRSENNSCVEIVNK